MEQLPFLKVKINCTILFFLRLMLLYLVSEVFVMRFGWNYINQEHGMNRIKYKQTKRSWVVVTRHLKHVYTKEWGFSMQHSNWSIYNCLIQWCIKEYNKMEPQHVTDQNIETQKSSTKGSVLNNLCCVLRLSSYIFLQISISSYDMQSICCVIESSF